MILRRQEAGGRRRKSVACTCLPSSFNPFHRRAYQGGAQHLGGFPFHQLQSLFGAGMIARNSDGRDQRPLPEILIIDLGHRHVELAAQAILQAFDGVALVFERMRLGELQLQGQDTDGRHWSGGRRGAAGGRRQAAGRKHPAACRLASAACPQTTASAATFSVAYASITTPGLMSPKFRTVTPHSSPVFTSLASFLKRFRDSIFPVNTTTLSRSTRISLSRLIKPSITMQPATLPTLLMRNTSRTWARP